MAIHCQFFIECYISLLFPIEKSTQSLTETEIQIKDEPEWDASSIEEEERSIAEMFQAEMNVKNEPTDEVDIEEDSLVSTLILFITM